MQVPDSGAWAIHSMSQCSPADNQRSFAKLSQDSAIQNWCTLKNKAGFQ